MVMGQVWENSLAVALYRHYNSSFHTGNSCWCQEYGLTKIKSNMRMCTLVNLRAGLLHNKQSVIKMKSQLHRLLQWAAVHYLFMQGDTFTCMKLSLCNYEGWTFTPQTLSSHYLLIHRPCSTFQSTWAFRSSMAMCTSSPRGLTSSP